MTYIVIELQTTNGSTSHIITTHTDRNSAESKFHTILAAAAVSQVEEHAALILTHDGRMVRNEVYRHPAQEEEQEEEPEEA